MEIVNENAIYKAWIKSELFGGPLAGGILAHNLPESYELANQGFLSESKWKRLILLIKCIRGLYLIPSH